MLMLVLQLKRVLDLNENRVRVCTELHKTAFASKRKLAHDVYRLAE